MQNSADISLKTASIAIDVMYLNPVGDEQGKTRTWESEKQSGYGVDLRNQAVYQP